VKSFEYSHSLDYGWIWVLTALRGLLFFFFCSTLGTWSKFRNRELIRSFGFSETHPLFKIYRQILLVRGALWGCSASIWTCVTDSYSHKSSQWPNSISISKTWGSEWDGCNADWHPTWWWCALLWHAVGSVYGFSEVRMWRVHEYSWEYLAILCFSGCFFHYLPKWFHWLLPCSKSKHVLCIYLFIHCRTTGRLKAEQKQLIFEQQTNFIPFTLEVWGFDV